MRKKKRRRQNEKMKKRWLPFFFFLSLSPSLDSLSLTHLDAPRLAVPLLLLLPPVRAAKTEGVALLSGVWKRWWNRPADGVDDDAIDPREGARACSMLLLRKEEGRRRRRKRRAFF